MGHSHVKALAARIEAAVAFIALCAALYCGAPLPAWAVQASAQADVGPSPTLARHAPAGVPQGYVITPFGYFHPSCVRTIGRDEVLLGDGRIKRADKSISTAQLCRYARFTKSGMRIDANSASHRGAATVAGHDHAPPEADGWLEASWYNDKAPFGGISANWSVPSAPEADVGQVLYYFPGLEDYEHVVSILQPVLGWNGFDDHAWTIASWNCCQGGNADHSVPEPAATGDAIAGTIRGNCPAGQVCSTWDIETVDKTTGRTTTLKQSGSYGQTFDWAFAGVVEVYGVDACTQYSSNGFVDFSAVSLLNVNKKALCRVPWTASGLLQDTAPACNYSVTVTPTSASLMF